MDFITPEILTKILNQLPNAVFALRLEDNGKNDFQIIFANHANEDATGISWIPFIGKSFREVFPDIYKTPLPDLYLKVIETNSKIEIGEIEYGDSIIRKQIFYVTANPVDSDIVVVSYENISALKKVISELNQKNKELEQFTYVASHDLQEPLRTISSSVDFLDKKLKGEVREEVGIVLRFLKNSANRMSTLVADLLVHSRIGREKELTEVDCRVVVNGILKDISALVYQKNADIKVGELPVVLAYKTELRLLFQNLITNAIKFKKPNLPVSVFIDAEELDKDWTFSVKDNGIGMNLEYKDKIFHIFQRLHSKKDYEGTGIGLAHCKKIIDLHEGEMWVESEPGKGSTFYFSIPK